MSFSVTYSGNTNVPDPFCMYLNSADAEKTAARPQTNVPGPRFYATDCRWNMMPPLSLDPNVKTHVQLVDASVPDSSFTVTAGQNDTLYIELIANPDFVDFGLVKAGQKYPCKNANHVLIVTLPEGQYDQPGGTVGPGTFPQAFFSGAAPPQTNSDGHIMYDKNVGQPRYYRGDYYKSSVSEAYYMTHPSDSLALDHVISNAIRDAVLRDIDDKSVELGWKLRLAQLVNFTPRRSWLGYGCSPMWAYNDQSEPHGTGMWGQIEGLTINYPSQDTLNKNIEFLPNGPAFAAMKTPAPTPDDAIAKTWAVPIPSQILPNTGYTVGKDDDPGTWNGGQPLPPAEADTAQTCWQMPYYSFLTCFWDPQVSRFAFNLFGRIPRRFKDPGTAAGGHYKLDFNAMSGGSGDYWMAGTDAYWGGGKTLNGDEKPGREHHSGDGVWGYWQANHIAGAAPTKGDSAASYEGYDPFAITDLAVLPPGRAFTFPDGTSGNTTDRNMNELIGFALDQASEVKFAPAPADAGSIGRINRHFKNMGGAQSPSAWNLADGFVDTGWQLPGTIKGIDPQGYYLYAWPNYLGYVKATGTDVKSMITFPLLYRFDKTHNPDTNPHVQDVDIPRLYAPNPPKHVANGSGTTAQPVNQAYVHCHLTEGTSYASYSNPYKLSERFIIPSNILGMVRSDMTGNLSVPYNSTRPMSITMGELSSIRMSLRDNSGNLIDNSSDWTVTLSFCFFLPSPYQGLLPQYAQGLIGSAQQQHSPVVEEIMQAQQLRNQVLQAQQNALINQQKAQQKSKKKPKKVSKNKNKKKKERKRRKKAAKKQQQQQQPPQQPPPQNAGLLLPVYAGQDIH